MFNDTDNGQTNYCPMCAEWAEKYDKLKTERNKYKRQYRKNRLDRKQAEQKLERIEEYCKEQNLKADYTACEILQIIDEVE